MMTSSTSAAILRLRSLPHRPYSFLSSISPTSVSFSSHHNFHLTSKSSSSSSRRFSSSSTPVVSELQALIFDCDGVILESEDLHRKAYNDAFSYFDVRCPPSDNQPLNWTSEFYDVFQNTVGGGKPKMRWYFREHGWPTSTVFQNPPEDNENREKLIDMLQILGTQESECLVIEDSVIGLQQEELGIGMPCIITYTSSTASQDFGDAIAIYPDLSSVKVCD